MKGMEDFVNELRTHGSPQKRSFREVVFNFITDVRVQTFLTVLLLFDVIFVIAGMALDAEYPACEVALKTCGLDPEKDHCVEVPFFIAKVDESLSLASSIILSIFTLEIVLTAYGVGIIEYVREPSYIFDGIVVIASLAIELLEGTKRHDTGLLVLARAWRFISLLHGMHTLRKGNGDDAGQQEQEAANSQYQPLTSNA